MMCPHCGQQNETNATICVNCQQALVTLPQLEVTANPVETPPANSVMQNPYAPLGYANFWRRLGADVIDLLIITLLMLVVTIIAAIATPVNLPDETLKQILYVCAFVLYLLYYSLFESHGKQATPGAHIFHYKITNADGHRLPFLRAIWHNIIRLIPYVGYLSNLLVLVTPQKQGLHDILAGAYAPITPRPPIRSKQQVN